MEQNLLKNEHFEVSGQVESESPAQQVSGLISRPVLQQFIRYVISGLLSFGTEFSLLYLLTTVLKLWYIYSNSIAFFIVFVVNFTLNRVWAFRSKQPLVKQVIASAFLFALNLAAGNLIMFFFTEQIELYYLYSKVIATGMSVTWNFFLYKYLIYK